MKLLFKYLFIFPVIFLAIPNNGRAQNSKKEKEAAALADVVKQVIKTTDYFFQPGYANSSGGSFTVATNYYLKVTKDTISVYLPYYGMAQTSRAYAGDGSIDFVWTDFSYVATESKNGKWHIVIKPGEKKLGAMKDAQTLTLLVSPDGSASLQVISTNRNPISFDGSVGNRN